VKSLADLSQSDVERILAIVDRLNDIEVRLEIDGMKLHVRKFSEASMPGASAGPAGVSLPQAHRPPAADAERAAALPMPQEAALPSAGVGSPAEPGLLEVRAPMLGRFFRASSPSEPPFVAVGSKVRPEDTVCMIEVMKLFNTVRAEVSGTIVEILVENGAMVEHDAVLFRVRPE
jgi:acetyl-CoA carboxylase biotin carboxyl carrier protein